MADEDKHDEAPGFEPGIGHNRPPLARSISTEESDFAEVTTAFLAEEYAKQPQIVDSLLAEATALLRDPATGKLKTIEDDDTKGKVASLIKRMRDAAKALAAFHGKEKQPYFRGGQAVDQFFFGLVDKLARRDKKNNKGAADVLNDMLTDYDARKLREEQARRERERQEQERIAREAREKAEQEAAAAEAARQAAERARKPETIEAKTEVAGQAEVRRDAATIDADLAGEKAEKARIETLRKPADIMRNRGSDGTLTTVAEEKYAEIVDRAKLDLTVLGPHIPLDALQTALNAWAKLTDYRQQMNGAAIGRRNKSIVR